MMKKLIVAFGLLATTLVRAEEDHSQHYGHVMPVESAVPDSGAEAAPAEPALPVPTAADLAAAFPDLGGMNMQDHMGSPRYVFVQIDKLEGQDTDAGTAAVWDGRIGWGGDSNRVWLKGAGERIDGRSESLETSLLWSHALARWWDSTLGLRQDSGEGASRTWVAFGVQGLAPYFFETELTAFVGESSHTALRLGAEYEARLTNRLILQPSAEINVYGKDEPASLIGSGLNDAEFGLRLRYEIRREIAPYAGVEWTRRFGEGADMARAAGAVTSDVRALAGIRFWY